MKKLLTLFVVFALALSCLVQVSAAGTTIYVAVDGSDENPGSLEAPVASLAKAAELAKGGDAVIYVKGGTYNVDKVADFSGVKNVKITSFNNEEVILTGAKKLDTKLFKKVTDKEILDRVTTKAAKDSLVAIDMKEAGVTELGAVSMCGFGYPAVPAAPQFIINGEMQTLARYPDKDYLFIDELVKGSDQRGNWDDKERAFSFRVNDGRLSNWKQADDIFIFGYFIHDWADATLACTINFEDKNLVSTEYPSVYGVKREGRFYFMNLLEEISVPGEWYLDRNTATLYAYPTEDFDKAKVDFVYYTDKFVNIDNAENVTIKGIDFSYGLSSAIVGKETKNVTITDCDFNNITVTVVDITNSYDAEISWCNFEEIGGTGIYLSGGDRQELIPGNCIITNCVFDGFQRVKPTGAPGVNLRGVGNTVSHSVFKDAANIAIWFGGNNHIIEYNDISHVCQDTADAGAIYAGRDWTGRGNEVRYNYIHDMKIIDTTTGMKVQAIYLDDGFSSAKVHGNIIKDVPSIALYGGGRYNTFENNIVIGGEEPFVFDQRYTTWDQASIRANSDDVDITHEAWKEAYPEIQKLYEDDPGVPKYNTIKNNVSFRSPGYNIYPLAKEHALEIKPDLEITKTDVFVDYRGGDLTLKEDCEVFTKLPEFEPINFKAIGLEEKPAEKTADDVLAKSIALKLNTPVTYVYGAKTQVDPENSAVMPQIVNDRTLVPVRFIAESLGGEVSWDDATKKVGIVLGEKTIELVLGKAELTVNGEVTVLDVPAQSIEGRTMLPLRAVTESLGMKVFWDNAGLIVISEGDVLDTAESELIAKIIDKF